MSDSLIKNIANDLKCQAAKVLLVENNDRFLFREDVIVKLAVEGINIVQGSPLKQRIAYELKDGHLLLILLSANRQNYLEDISSHSIRYEFFLQHYLGSYHIPSLINEELPILEILFSKNPVVGLTKKETLKEILSIKSQSPGSNFDTQQFKDAIEAELTQELVNWPVVLEIISDGLIAAIGSKQYNDIVGVINDANEIFQKDLAKNYAQLKNTSAVKSPKIVSKILDYIDFNYKAEKIALIVVDGLSSWQYDLFRDRIQAAKQEGCVYSWLPSITQLSRQAIFKGDSPERTYRQNPANEEKLWLSYWKNKGLNSTEIRYQHENTKLENLAPIKRFALVFKDLDDYMHSSKDYTDLLKLTENWISRSKIVDVVHQLLNQNFRVFITSDHGNIQAKGWRSLQGREKLGTNKSGSRSERHIEYSENWLKDDLLKNNPNLNDSVAQEEQAIYFKNNFSFSSKESLVTHGGSHILEVLIPFVEIKNDQQ